MAGKTMSDGLYNVAFERSLLSSLLFEPKQFEDVKLVSSDFYLPSHQAIFSSMGYLVSNNMPIDEEFIKKELVKLKAFDEQTMMEIMSANPISNLGAYEDEIKEKAKLRKLIDLTTNIKKLVFEDDVHSDQIISDIESEILNIENSSDLSMPIDILDAIKLYDKTPPPPIIQTGIPQIDSMLGGGIEPGQLIHVGGKSNTGKTILTKQILRNISQEHNVLFLSFEMNMRQIIKQFISREFREESYFIADKIMIDSDISNVAKVIKRMKHKHDIKFVLVDSRMELQHKHFKGFSTSDKVTEIDSILKMVASELDLVIFEISQLSKDDIKNGTMSGFNSGLSDYLVDMKLLLSFMDSEEDLRRKIEVKKNRQTVNHFNTILRLDKSKLEFGANVVETIYKSANKSYKNEDEEVGISLPTQTNGQGFL